MNDADAAAWVLDVAGRLVGEGGIPLAEAPPNHSNRMVIHEPAMAVGSAMYAAIAMDECGDGAG